MAFNLAGFADYQLRVGLRVAGPIEIKTSLLSLTQLVELIDDKDHFLKQYEKLTAFRLINETCVSREAEEIMLAMIVDWYGMDQVSRLK